jgi:hypothetical protein
MSQMMFNSTSMQYDMFQYGATPSSFYPSNQSGKIPVEYNNVAAIDQTDRRRRRSGSTSAPAPKDKETIPNMHMVRPSIPTHLFQLTPAPLTDSFTAPTGPKSSLSKGFQRTKRKARQRSRAPTGRSPREAPRSSTVIYATGRRSFQAQRPDRRAHC